jgi:hypothetical protein
LKLNVDAVATIIYQQKQDMKELKTYGVYKMSRKKLGMFTFPTEILKP